MPINRHSARGGSTSIHERQFLKATIDYLCSCVSHRLEISDGTVDGVSIRCVGYVLVSKDDALCIESGNVLERFQTESNTRETYRSRRAPVQLNSLK